MVIFWPTFSLAGSTPGLAALRALSVTPWLLAILPRVSPWTTTYSVPAGGCTTTGGGATGGLDAIMGGGFVSMATVLVSTVGWLASSVCSRLQPWISMATRPAVPITDMHSTASFNRERRLLASSNREPWGTNGFGLFIALALIASFLRGVFDLSAAKFSLGKFHGVLNSSRFRATGGSHHSPLNRLVKRPLRRSLRVRPLPPEVLTAGAF